MIKKQIDWQADKFSFSSDMTKNQIYQNLRKELKAMFQNGWELTYQGIAGYDPQNGDVIVVIGLTKYEYVPDDPGPSVKLPLDVAGTSLDEVENLIEEKDAPRRGRTKNA